MFRSKTTLKTYIEDKNIEYDKRDQRILFLKGELTRLGQEKDKLLAESEADIMKYWREMIEPINAELRQLEEDRTKQV